MYLPPYPLHSRAVLAGHQQMLPCALSAPVRPVPGLYAYRRVTYPSMERSCLAVPIRPRPTRFPICPLPHVSVPIAILCSFASEITHTYIRNGAPRPPFYSAKRSATHRRLSFSAFVSFLRPYPYLCTDGHPLGTFPTKFVRFRVDIFSCCVCVDSTLLTFVV